VCSARCAVHPASSPTFLVAVAIALALPTALGTSRLAAMASWPGMSTSQVRFDAVVVPVVPGSHPIVFTAVDNLLAVPIALDDSGRLLQLHMASSLTNSTQRVRFAAAARPASGAF